MPFKKSKRKTQISTEEIQNLKYWREKLIFAESKNDKEAIKVSKLMLNKYLDDYLNNSKT